MTGARSPVPRLDKLPTLTHQELSHSSIGSVHHSFTSSNSASSDSEPPRNEHQQAGRKVAETLRGDKPARTSLVHEHTQHRGRPLPTNPPSLSPLSAILSSSSQGAPLKKASSQNSRLKEILRERAVSHGVSRLGSHEAAPTSAPPEPQTTSSTAEPQMKSAAVSPLGQAESSLALCPEGSTTSIPGMAHPPGMPIISDEDIQRAVRYFAGERDADSFTDEKLLEKCGPFYPGLTLKDARLLVGHGSMSADKLRKVVRIALHRDLGDFDPITEAFKVLDPRGTGHADMDVLAAMLSHMPGIRALSTEDRDFLLKISDVDGDGLMSEADFRRCSTFLPATPFDQLTASQ